MNTLQEILKQATEGYAVELTNAQLEQFDLYYQLLTEWNQKINLTAITDNDDSGNPDDGFIEDQP